MFVKILLVIGLLAAGLAPAEARRARGVGEASAFNNGVYEMQPNFPGIGGDYPFVNRLKNSSGGWDYRDNQGTPSPDDLDDYGYPLPGSDAITNHTGLRAVVRLPAQAYIGGNCPGGLSGICFASLANGKGTIANPTTILTSAVVGGTATVATGATTTITFSVAQAFRAGMEVPISGTTGVTATNGGGGSLTAGGSSGAWTVCSAGLTSTTIQLCLNDQTTPLTTTGTPGGTTVVTYGRNAVGVCSGGAVIGRITTSPTSVDVGIVSQDATCPMTYRNGIDGLAFVTLGADLARWDAGHVFSNDYRNATVTARPAVWRHLNTLNTNLSQDVHWADRMPVGYFSYGTHQYNRRGTSVYVGTTTSTKNDYVASSVGGGTLTDRRQIIISFNATAVSVASGAGALVTWPSHGLTNADPISFSFIIGGGGAAPTVGGNSIAGTTYYAITTCGSCDADTIQFATSAANANAGTAVTTTGTGTNVVAQATVAGTSVTITGSSPNITWSTHNLSVNDPVALYASGGLPAAFSELLNYYVKTVVDPNTITLSATPGGAAITPATGGTVSAVRSPTLNLDGNGAIPIRSLGQYGVGLVTTSYPLARSSAGIKLYASMIYDEVMGSWQKNGGDVSRGTEFFVSGWPPEIALRDCIEIGAHCWFTSPRYTLDGATGITDWIPGLAAMARSTAPYWMEPRFEIQNELWNGAADFPATPIMRGHALVYKNSSCWVDGVATGTGCWTDGTLNQLAGKVGSLLGQAVNAAYGGGAPAGRYQAIMGVQTFSFQGVNHSANNAPRLTASDYVDQSPAAQTGYTKSPASDWLTHVACAQYFAPGYTGTSRATTLAANNSGGVIRASISGTTLTLGSVRSATTPAFGTGSIITQGPGVTRATVTGGGPTDWTLDVDQGTVGSTDIAYISSGHDPAAVQEYLDSSYRTAQFTASISGTTMTVSSVASGYIFPTGGSGGNNVIGVGVDPYTQISAQLTGTANGAGTYTVSPSQTVASVTMTSHGVFDLPSFSASYTRIVSFAGGYSNQWAQALRVNGYEGGLSPDFGSSGLSLTDQLYAGAKLVTSSPMSPTGIYGVVRENAQNFHDAGGEYASQFNFTGISPANNAWSAIDDIYMPTDWLIINAYKSLTPKRVANDNRRRRRRMAKAA